MAKPSDLYFCSECGDDTPRWAGRCPACGQWNTLVAVPRVDRESAEGHPAGAPASVVSLGEIDPAGAAAVTTGVPELDRVLSGGLVAGSVTLLGGEPGVGKSTLVLQVLSAWADGRRLLVSAEESGAQVRARAERLGLAASGIDLLPTTSVAEACGAIAGGLVVVDSIQTLHDRELPSAAASVAQVTRCAQRLAAAARESGAAVVLVGHVTKDGSLAGPRSLEHLVDTVLTFEGDPARQLRMLRAVKHRFGPTGELGLFEMGGSGLAGVTEPGTRFLGEPGNGLGGSAVAASVDGHRTLMVEVQALVVPLASNDAAPRWAAQGVEQRRISLLSAVLARRCGVAISRCDVYASVTGGARLADPGADLALALALASAREDRPLPRGLAAVGEVGLTGEVRPVGRGQARLTEAARLGFDAVLVPRADAAAAGSVKGVEAVPVSSLAEALCVAELAPRRRAASAVA